MRIRTLSRYILTQYLGNLLLGLLIFTFVLLLDRFFELVDLLVHKGAGLGLTLKLLMTLLPTSLSLTLPMSNLLAALLTFGHLSETNEITAARASGVASAVRSRVCTAEALSHPASAITAKPTIISPSPVAAPCRLSDVILASPFGHPLAAR